MDVNLEQLRSFVEVARFGNFTRAAEVLLERGDLAAQRGLGEVQLLGGPGEVAEAGHLDEAAQLLEVHIDSVRVSSQRYICIGVIG